MDKWVTKLNRWPLKLNKMMIYEDPRWLYTKIIKRNEDKLVSPGVIDTIFWFGRTSLKNSTWQECFDTIRSIFMFNINYLQFVALDEKHAKCMWTCEYICCKCCFWMKNTVIWRWKAWLAYLGFHGEFKNYT